MSISAPVSFTVTGGATITIPVTWVTNPAGSTMSIFGTTYKMNDVFDAPGLVLNSLVGGGNTMVVTSVATASGTPLVTVYTGTFPGGAANALAGSIFVVAGFVTAANNGTFTVTASSATTLTVNNTAGVSETHAATATTSCTLYAAEKLLQGLQTIISAYDLQANQSQGLPLNIAIA